MEKDEKPSWASAVSSSSSLTNENNIVKSVETISQNSSKTVSEKKENNSMSKTNVWKARQERMVKLSNSRSVESTTNNISLKQKESPVKTLANGDSLNSENMELTSILSDTESWPTLDKAVSEEGLHEKEKEKPSHPLTKISGKEKWVSYTPTITHAKPLPTKPTNRIREGRIHDNSIRGSAKNGITNTEEISELFKNREHKIEKGKHNKRAGNIQEKRDARVANQAPISKDKNTSITQPTISVKENKSEVKDINEGSNELSLENLELKDNSNGTKEEVNRYNYNNVYRSRGGLHMPFIQHNTHPLLNINAFVQAPNIYLPFRPPTCGNLTIPFYPNEKYHQSYMYDYSHINHVGMFMPIIYDPMVLKNCILSQIDYYFSVENLCKDLFLRRHMDSQGWVNLLILANFNRIRSFALEYNFIRDITTYSRTVDVNFSDGYDLVRKKEGWEIWVLPEEERDPSVRSGRSLISTKYSNNEKPTMTPKALKESIDALPFLPRTNLNTAPFSSRPQEMPSNQSNINLFNQRMSPKTLVSSSTKISSINKTEKSK
ncbi:hypothetical protein T552_03400 [Pneumocystis carinii B80]|uniref:HTH La-type RNA-binding domain-containing protein n=1 Tax=Pneumocystis carinii (strain B80) TaxID=1408658 RepID=A0A0W4ZBL1_PNEC8|nr:hypothetical protein T552_03400 [Pneumocystis carinii B80]KTW25787.1 hypothetical protein T552_03400 [Pneumocystis carinii B80]